MRATRRSAGIVPPPGEDAGLRQESGPIPDSPEAPKHPRQFSLTAVFLFVTYLCLLAAAGRVLCQFQSWLQTWEARTDTGSSVLDLVFPTVFLTIILVAAAFADHGLSLALASRRWLRTTGVIVGGCVVEHLDGISVTYPTWHLNVRASNTEPLIRLNLEATTREEMERRRDEALAIIRG